MGVELLAVLFELGEKIPVGADLEAPPVAFASSVEKDFGWMLQHNPMKAELENVSDDIALMAIQGPKAFDIVRKLTDVPIDDIKYYHFVKVEPGRFLGCDFCILSHTGYTGEPGLEIYCEPAKAGDVWDALMAAGAEAWAQEPYELKIVEPKASAEGNGDNAEPQSDSNPPEAAE